MRWASALVVGTALGLAMVALQRPGAAVASEMQVYACRMRGKVLWRHSKAPESFDLEDDFSASSEGMARNDARRYFALRLSGGRLVSHTLTCRSVAEHGE
jgi:hypothetical protein